MEPGGNPALEASPARRGTTVSVKALFERFPARRQFLKRPSSEAAQCRQVFVEKALAHPWISFAWSSAGEVEHLHPSTLKDRIALLYREIPAPALSVFQAEAEGSPFSIVYADPSYSRRDRKFLQIFVNRRRVPEWGLGIFGVCFQEYLPGGMRPCAFLFIEVDPSLADFNIHPAKREVRIKNAEALKSTIYAAFKGHLRSSLGTGIKPLTWNSREKSYSTPLPGSDAWQKLDGKALDRAFWDRLDSERRLKGEEWAFEKASDEGRSGESKVWEVSAAQGTSPSQRSDDKGGEGNASEMKQHHRPVRPSDF